MYTRNKAQLVGDLIGGVILSLLLLMLNSTVKGEESTFDEKVRRSIESLKSRGPVTKEKYIEIDTKKVHFFHRRHQDLIKELGEGCEICHHKRKEGQDPKACRRCHAGQRTASKGKYARVGQKLNQKDIFHLLCGNCHQKMLQQDYRRANGTPGVIPIKCHHCHEIKQK